MGRIEVDAFVLAATGPDAGWTTGRQQLALAVRLPDGRLVVVDDDPKATHEQWIVRGMTVPVSIDPGKPKKCDVLVERIAPLSQRMAARDRALTALEEVAAEVRAVRAQADMGSSEVAAAMMGVAAGFADRDLALAQERLAARPQAPQLDAEGRLRGTADLIAYEQKPSSRAAAQNDNAGWKAARLVRIWLFGHQPYVVKDEVEISPRHHAEATLAGGGVPVSAPADGSTDVRYLLDERTVSAAPAAPPPLAVEAQLTAAAVTDAQASVVKASLDAVPPAMRPVVAEQLRASGLHVPDEWI